MGSELTVTLESTAQDGDEPIILAKALAAHWRMQGADPNACSLQESAANEATLGQAWTGAVVFVLEHWRNIRDLLLSLKGLLASRKTGQAGISMRIQCGEHELTLNGDAFMAGDLAHWEKAIASLCKKLANLPK